MRSEGAVIFQTHDKSPCAARLSPRVVLYFVSRGWALAFEWTIGRAGMQDAGREASRLLARPRSKYDHPDLPLSKYRRQIAVDADGFEFVREPLAGRDSGPHRQPEFSPAARAVQHFESEHAPARLNVAPDWPYHCTAYKCE